MAPDASSRDAGRVWLVGAGPGDPGLITARGLRCIAEADVIIYDSLVNPVLLAEARPECELLYAGKRAGRHSMKQDETNALIAERAQAGRRVCRLKGGDPFVFGRGGEEALYLRDRGIPFEVVPGVTSAVAAPAYAGIPVTHRAVAASVRIVTGHEDPAKDESQLDWDELAATSGTLVFLMGVQNLERIAGMLAARGKPASTPAAVISNGTLPGQRTVAGTLEDIGPRARAARIGPPAVLVIGEVAALRDQLKWFEARALFGRTLVVTRARAQSSEFAAALRELGADAIEAPAIQTKSLADSEAMRAAAREADQYNWLVFTSANGAEAFFNALDSIGLDARALAGVRAAVIGPGTAESLRRHGVRPDLVPEQFVAEALLEALERTEPFTGQRYLVPRSDIARPGLVDGLRSRGAAVTEVAAYTTLRGETLPEGLVERLEAGSIDLVTFTSSSTVRNFANALPEARRAALLARVRAASIGPVTSAALRSLDIPIAVEAAESTIPGLTAAIVDHFAHAGGPAA